MINFYRLILCRPIWPAKVCTKVVEEEETEEYDPDKSGAGPIKDRSCTDVLCLGLLISFIVLWGFIAIWAFNYGDPSKLMYPTDSFGDVCGRGDFSSKPYLLFFDLTKCISLSALTGCATPQVCVAECPGENYSPWMESQAPNIIGTHSNSHQRKESYLIPL